MEKFCIFDEDKICDNCKECETCDLDPNKICDNCGKCIETKGDYGAVEINDILLNIENED